MFYDPYKRKGFIYSTQNPYLKMRATYMILNYFLGLFIPFWLMAFKLVANLIPQFFLKSLFGKSFIDIDNHSQNVLLTIPLFNMFFKEQFLVGCVIVIHQRFI